MSDALYINLSENVNAELAVEQAIAFDPVPTHLIFIGSSFSAEACARQAGMPFEVLPAGASVPLGERRLFCGGTARAC